MLRFAARATSRVPAISSHRFAPLNSGWLFHARPGGLEPAWGYPGPSYPQGAPLHPDESVRKFLKVDRGLITFGHPILDIRSPEPLQEPFAIEFLTRFETEEGVRSVGTLLQGGSMKGQGRLKLDLQAEA